MGAIISSKADINPVLAAQTPQSSFNPPKVSSTNSSSLPLEFRLSIPQLQHSVEPKAPLNQSSTSHESTVSVQPIQFNDTSSNLNQLVDRQVALTASSLQPSPMHSYNPMVNADAKVIFRSVLNLDDHQRWNVYPLSSIVEHRGKQFVSEYRERLERRYVQVYDESIGRMRLFEVTDYIPSRTVRPVRKINVPRPTVNQNSREALPPLSNAYRHRIPEQNQVKSTPVRPNPVETVYNRSQGTQSNTYDSATIDPEVSNNYYTSGSYRSQASSLRAPLAAASVYSSSDSSAVSVSMNDSRSQSDRDDDLDSDRSSHIAPIGRGKTDSPASRTIDPFAKTAPVTAHPYGKKQTGKNQYTEPVIVRRTFPTSAVSDYTPIKAINQQLNRERSSRRRNSKASGYNV